MVGDPTPWGTESAGTLRLRIHVQPRASRSEVVGRHGDAIKIRLAAPPVDGAANEALIRFLAAALAIPRSRLALVSGASSRAKVVRIEGVTAAEVRQRLQLG
jgi:uncharacterized protein (TIGR00251 family)